VLGSYVDSFFAVTISCSASAQLQSRKENRCRV
jgi:hypothetical protein